MKTIGSKLKALRNRENLSQKRVAQALNISNVQLSRYESDDRTPDPYILKKIADYFGVSMDYFVTDEDITPVITVVGNEQIKLSEEEYKIFKEIQKYPVMFNDLKTDPEKKIKQLIKMWKFIKEDIEEETEDQDIIDD